MRDTDTTTYGRSMILADEYLLLVTKPDGSPYGADTLDMGVAGAFLCDLTGRQRLQLVDDGSVQSVDTSATGDELTDRVLRDFSERSPQKPDRMLPSVGKGLPTAVYERLAAAGAVNHRTSKTLGLFTRHTWEPVPGAQRDQLVEEMARVLRGEQTPDERTGALVALIQASDLTHPILGESSGLSRKEARDRASAIASGDWASAAVGKAVTEAQAAILAATVMITVAGTGNA